MNNTSTSENSLSTCANCGKGEEAGINLKACMACKLVKYCSRDCQIAHRSQHKKECKKRAKELHDEKLFKQPPQLEDCPICFMRLPTVGTGKVYMACCGKIICSGCVHAFQSRVTKKEHDICPFCRTPPPKSDEECLKRLEKRMELNDAQSFYNLGCRYSNGRLGLPQDYAKALELWHRAGELGCAVSYSCIGNAYDNGRGVDVDKKKAIHYWELAAMKGHASARNNIGVDEANSGNMERALKHWVIAVENGNIDSLKNIKQCYVNEHIEKEEYAKALRSYQAFLDEIKSDQRDEAFAYNDDYRYYESSV